MLRKHTKLCTCTHNQDALATLSIYMNEVIPMVEEQSIMINDAAQGMKSGKDELSRIQHDIEKTYEDVQKQGTAALRAVKPWALRIKKQAESLEADAKMLTGFVKQQIGTMNAQRNHARGGTDARANTVLGIAFVP
jgi:hypothetical protein